jgi:hypothetical protein
MTELKVGQTLYGYCGGVFGGDSYSTKRVEAVGFDWVVVREVYGDNPMFVRLSQSEMARLVEDSEEWQNYDDGDPDDD